MERDTGRIERFFATHHPFATLDERTRAALAAETWVLELADGAMVYEVGDDLEGLYAIAEGSIGITAPTGELVSRLHQGECFGERGLFIDGTAPYRAVTHAPSTLYLIPAKRFLDLVEAQQGFALFFGRAPSARNREAEEKRDGTPATLRIGEMMTENPIAVGPDDPVAGVAALMHEKGISCVLVEAEGRLVGLVTASDLCGRVLGAGLPASTAVRKIMTADPLALERDAIGFDAMRIMVENRIGHLPIVSDGRPVGIVTRTDLLLRHALSSPMLIGEIARRKTVAELAATIAKVPDLLAQLTAAGTEAHVICRLITDITDALTRRLIAMAEAELGPPPVPYLWLVCGSQGRQEQTGVSDQDNCMILDDAAQPEHDDYFAALAKSVSDGLDACGFYYCPGDMMATNPQWRQPISVWRRYFRGWIDKPDPMARMLASVMFDLRPIAGEMSLFEGLQAETLARAKANSIFIAHMVANSLHHQPPLGLFRGFALIRSGEHKNSVDLKHNGVVPVVDLARLYALMGELPAANTRKRLIAARESGIVSETGGQDLIDAYDLIAETRLRHQAALIRQGSKPDNFMLPAALSDLERTHLRNAFVVIKTMQAAVAQGRQTVV